MTVKLSGRIDSANAAQAEADLLARLDGQGACPVVLDAAELSYISSAGLRVLLRIRKSHPDMTLRGVSPDVYEILEMTGFTEMMKVEKAYRTVSVEGCEEIGRGANGTIYRIDRDNVVKVYNNADALEDIKHEREVARLALVLGIPTAISYDVVRVGESYGSVFELLNARSFSKIIATEPEKLDWCALEYVKMLKKIHGTEVPPGKLPDMKETALSWARFTGEYLPEPAAKKLLSLISAVPHSNRMIHGDYHTKNLELQGDEVLIIDMDTLAVGHPVFELASMYNAYVGFPEVDHEITMKFQGFDYDTGVALWRRSLALYLGTENEEIINRVEDKAAIVGYTRLIRREIRRRGLENAEGTARIELWKRRLISLLEKTDTLLFTSCEQTFEATVENLPAALDFINAHLEAADCPAKAQMQIELAAEEIFVNIANYAYAPDTGEATVRAEVAGSPPSLTLTFIDGGAPYDPLSRKDPDVTLSAEERPIGGLGILLTKKIMDGAEYEYKDGKNILTLKKTL